MGIFRARQNKKFRLIKSLGFAAAFVFLASCSNNNQNPPKSLDDKEAFLHSSSSFIVGGQAVPEYSILSGSIAGLVIVKRLSPQAAQAARAQGSNISKENVIIATCTGSILSSNLILTAAHCVFEEAGEKVVQVIAVFGSKIHQIVKSKELMQNFGRAVVGYRVSPLYVRNKDFQINNGDLALLRFEGGLPPGFQPATIAPQFEMIKQTDRVILAGYGSTGNKPLLDSQGSPVRNNFGEIQYVPIEPNSSGLLRYTTSTVTGGLTSARKSGGKEELQFIPNTRTSEIAVDQTRGRGPCLGDSGGPAYTLVANKLYLWGVSSRGDVSCKSQAIYTNILSHLPWVEKARQELLLPIKKIN